ncbi:MAG: hypothetical protein HUK17_01460, partial [Bacteroidales bacterium]|nr:hypothetical protein [Bacteroidales bacterium]
MAQNTNFTLFNKGHFYEFTAYVNPQTKQTVIRPRYNYTGKGVRTMMMQMNRMRWANIVHAYQQMGPFLKKSFTQRPDNQNNAQAFMAANFAESTVYLTKKESRDNTCILEPFVISSGNLRSITLTKVGNKLVSDILVRGLTAITSATTIGELSRGIVANPDALTCKGMEYDPTLLQNNKEIFKNLDELWFYRVQQEYADVPYISVVRRGLQLNLQGTGKVWEQTGPDGFEIVHATIDGKEGNYLACNEVEETAVAYVHSRKNFDNTTEVSSQTLVGKSALVEDYSSQQGLIKAIDSYGGLTNVNYMTPEKNNDAYKKEQDAATGSGSGDPAPAGKVTITTAVS